MKQVSRQKVYKLPNLSLSSIARQAGFILGAAAGEFVKVPVNFCRSIKEGFTNRMGV